MATEAEKGSSGISIPQFADMDGNVHLVKGGPSPCVSDLSCDILGFELASSCLCAEVPLKLVKDIATISLADLLLYTR